MFAPATRTAVDDAVTAGYETSLTADLPAAANTLGEAGTEEYRPCRLG